MGNVGIDHRPDSQRVTVLCAGGWGWRPALGANSRGGGGARGRANESGEGLLDGMCWRCGLHESCGSALVCLLTCFLPSFLGDRGECSVRDVRDGRSEVTISHSSHGFMRWR